MNKFLLDAIDNSLTSKMYTAFATHDVHCVIAGGYARDKYYNRTPRDLDIAVYGPQVDELFKTIIGQEFPDSWVVHTSYADQGAIHGVIKHGNVDFIFHKDALSEQDVVNKFDCNLNQFILDDYGSPIFQGLIHPKHGLIFVKQDLKPTRVASMYEKFCTYTNPLPNVGRYQR